MSEHQIGGLISEGKTKRVFNLIKSDDIVDDLVYITNKDNISAGDNSRNQRVMEGKGRITVETSSAIFEFLNAVGIGTAFVSRVEKSDNSFVAKKCQMIPIEIVIRRIAFGTYLKLNPEVSEGFKFVSPVIEIHIKDDANHDPLWSVQQLVDYKFYINGLLIDEECVNQIFKIARLVFEILERVWHSIDYQLVDLKVEFGVILDQNQNKCLVLADIIDNETWRLWPNGDKNLMVDKQIYRKYSEGQVDAKVISHVRDVFQNVSNIAQMIFSTKRPNFKHLNKTRVYILLGDDFIDFANELVKSLNHYYGVNDVEVLVYSEMFQDSPNIKLDNIISLVNQGYCEIFVNLGVKSKKIEYSMVVPVIDCFDNDQTVIRSVSLSVAKVLAVSDVFVWSKIKAKQCFDLIINDL